MTNLYMNIIIFFILFIIPLCYCDNGDQFRNCSLLFNCGSLQGVGYPFWGGDRPSFCGLQDFYLTCVGGQYTTIRLDHQYYSPDYRVLAIDPSIPKMTIARDDLSINVCPNKPLSFFKNITLSNFNLNSFRTVRNLHIFYGCTSEVIAKVQVQSNVTCSIDGENSTGVFFAHEFVPDVQGCNFSFLVPIQLAAYNDLWDRKITLEQALNQGFDVEYNAALAACSSCEASGGKCGSGSTYQFICICTDQSHPMLCPQHGKGRWLKLMIGMLNFSIFFLVIVNAVKKSQAESLSLVAGAIMAGIGIISCLIICYCYYKKCSDKCRLFLKTRKTKNDKELEAFIKEYGSLTPSRYNYSDIKKMTNHFKQKLGQGGYGEVYRGNLYDKRPVAVKILSTTKGNGEEFINEVASISKTSHVNIVTLVGFCLEGHKRALVYEFMPNGSLEKYIHHDSEPHLGPERLHEIAIGVARGLEYLHGGCNTRILHLDIKPHNILLDEDFCPKISDFGLAKLCARKESVVSMLGAIGTVGYIAPEVISRSFGGVSYKSDVYSYGMMVLEMVGGRNNAINIQLSSTSETYFPDWLYHCIVNDEDLKLQGHDMTQQENEIARKMILVGLWCIQTVPLNRPTMSKVIDMLEGSLEYLEIPPQPFLFSPSEPEAASLEMAVLPKKFLPSSRSAADSYTTSA